MSNPVFFIQSCPVCGRSLQIRVTLLGRQVFCQHCGGGFVATDRSMERSPCVADKVEDLILRAERVIEEAAVGMGNQRDGAAWIE